jgi:uncharacterized protein YndB with AHSA1/START domain
MTPLRLLAIGLALVAAQAAYAAPPVVVETLVNAPVADVWKAYATKEGQEAWMVAHADVDMRVGGKLRAHYDPKGVLGDADTIVNEVMAFEPERMVSIRVAQAPQDFPFKTAVQSMWTVLYFTPVGAQSTSVRAVSLGIPDDEEGQKMRVFFARGNEWTLQRLAAHFQKKPGGEPAAR